MLEDVAALEPLRPSAVVAAEAAVRKRFCNYESFAVRSGPSLEVPKGEEGRRVGTVDVPTSRRLSRMKEWVDAADWSRSIRPWKRGEEDQ